MQQQAIKNQAELLQRGKQPNLNAILQALINIDKEAREANIQLGGPSSMLGQAKTSANRSPAPTPGSTNDAKPRSFWQGIIKWGASGQSDENMFTLVVASAMHFPVVPHSLALPWPNLLTINAFVPATSSALQQLITSRRVPCALLSVRAFPQNMAVRGAENNEQNYRLLAATLMQNQRAAYIPHGAPNCGLLLAAVGRRSGGPPQLLALVFQTPIPLAQLATQPSGSSSTNTRGMIAVSQPPNIPSPASQGPQFPQTDPLATSQVPPSAPVVYPGQMAPSQNDALSQLLARQSLPLQNAEMQSALIHNLLGQSQSGVAQPSHAQWNTDQGQSMGFGL